ncbi:MAG TPA: hypothetical protein VK578_14620 [Edaphobacter sp.]|nr:hypothetical protein [Edaphobacter sp.]
MFACVFSQIDQEVAFAVFTNGNGALHIPDRLIPSSFIEARVRRVKAER